MVCPFDLKKSRNDCRISKLVIAMRPTRVGEPTGQDQTKFRMRQLQTTGAHQNNEAGRREPSVAPRPRPRASEEGAGKATLKDYEAATKLALGELASCRSELPPSRFTAVARSKMSRRNMFLSTGVRPRVLVRNKSWVSS
jgi:hypothetical protein